MQILKLEEMDLLEIGNTIQISGMMMNGGGTSFLIPLPDEDFHKLVVLDMDVEDWKTFLRQTDILETEVLMEDANGFKKAILRKSTRQIDSKVSWKVFKRDGYTCRYCGRDDVPLTVDHLVLWENGGPTIEENLVSACKKCNKTRGNTEYEHWLESDYYQRVSQNLPKEIVHKNIEVVEKLPYIPIQIHKPSRKKKKKRR